MQQHHTGFCKSHSPNKIVKMPYCMAIWIWTPPLSSKIRCTGVMLKMCTNTACLLRCRKFCTFLTKSGSNPYLNFCKYSSLEQPIQVSNSVRNFVKGLSEILGKYSFIFFIASVSLYLYWHYYKKQVGFELVTSLP